MSTSLYCRLHTKLHVLGLLVLKGGIRLVRRVLALYNPPQNCSFKKHTFLNIPCGTILVQSALVVQPSQKKKKYIYIAIKAKLYVLGYATPWSQKPEIERSKQRLFTAPCHAAGKCQDGGPFSPDRLIALPGNPFKGRAVFRLRVFVSSWTRHTSWPHGRAVPGSCS